MNKEKKNMFQLGKVDSKTNIANPQVSSKEKPPNVIDAHGKNYLGEVMSMLPNNVFLNKVKTGCGLTSLALECNGKTVISAPYKNLIESKDKWCRNKGISRLIVSAGVNKNDILNFKGDKILTTYDSLGKVVEALEEKGDLKDYKLVVDEAHNLVAVADYRENAVRTVLDSYQKFGSFLFATATPIQEEYQLPSLRKIPKVSIDWGFPEKIRVKFSAYTGSVTKQCAELASDFIIGKESGNAHIFINSVIEIINAIQYMQMIQDIDSSDIRIVCAKKEENSTLIQNKLDSSFSIGSITGAATKVNFYTGTAFEGCDIYDYDGKTFVFVNGKKDHTKINLLTELPQISGRIRDSNHRGRMELHYSISMFQDVLMSEKEYSEKIKEELSSIKRSLENFNNLKDEGLKKYALAGMRLNNFIRIKDDKPFLKEEMWYNKMFWFSTLKQVYKMDGEHIVEGVKINNGIEYSYEQIPQIKLNLLGSVKLDKFQSFKEQCQIYFDHKRNSLFNDISPILMIDKLIVKAYELLGEKKMNNLDLRKNLIQKECDIRDTKLSKEGRIIKLLNLRNGKFYSLKELKDKLTKIYHDLSIDTAPKATEIENWYVADKCTRRILGKQTRGYKIIELKLSIQA